MLRRHKTDTAPLLASVEKHIRLSDDEVAFFLSRLEEKTVSRRTLLAKEGEVCKHSIFVVDGALKSYTVDKQSNEHVISFALSGWWIADMYSLIHQKPGVLRIEALADSSLLLLSKQKQEELYERIPKFERFFRIITENALVASQQRIINNLTLTAEERYLTFTEKYPFVMECAPLHNIASYLGMTPEFLSKIRRRIAIRK
ncbi:Crp/Fnr family transcriptional regulator [Chryseolinea sp. T2]|uniref:Crp/Fnr family transcriptional regulator n=1 Tax=Chryseolinea sp. T2 TaxID=3129255 RepID=UPI003077CEF0